jgi:hypothetical protein
VRFPKIIAVGWLALIWAFAPGHAAEKRVALVVGNAAYRHAGVPKLDNPVSDARGMRDALKPLGFDVIYGEDLDQYAARGRTAPGVYPRFWFGDDEKDLCRYGNFWDQKTYGTDAPCNDGYARTSPAGHYAPNAFGLYGMFGNAWQWTADCPHGDYNGAPADGSAWTTGTCTSSVVLRGGSGASPREEPPRRRSQVAHHRERRQRVSPCQDAYPLNLYLCAPRARMTSGGRTHPDRSRSVW